MKRFSYRLRASRGLVDPRMKFITGLGLAMLTLTLVPTGPLAAAENAAIKPPAKARVEVCFVLDTTGSMSGLIEGAKQKIWAIANQMVSAKPTPALHLALIGYRDRGDAYVTKITNLTDDLDALYASLRALTADGGGDTPESVNQALHEAVTKISWSPDRDVLKIIFLVGDAPPHMDYANEIRYPEVCQMAVKRELIINTIQCGNSIPQTPAIWQQIAKLSEGSYAAIGQTGDMIAIATPLDAEIAELNRKLGQTLIAYGTAPTREAVHAKQALAEAAPSDTIADRLGYNARTSKTVQGGGELLDALQNGEITLEKVRREELPPELQKLSADELKTHIEKTKAARTQLQQQLLGTLQKRDAFLAAERQRLSAGDRNSFDAKIAETIRTQAARKGLQYAN